MFKVEFLVEDKRLASVLTGLSGQVMDLQVVHVVNVTANGAAKTSGKAIDLLRQHILDAKVKSFRVSEIVPFWEQMGRKRSSLNIYLMGLMKEKFIRKTGRGTGTVYHLSEKQS